MSPRPPRHSQPPSMQSMMQQMAGMQAAVEEHRRQMAETTFEGTAGGGVVKAEVLGTGELRSVVLDPSVLDPEDPELVGDLVVAAVNQALQAMSDATAEALGGITGLGGLLG